MNWTEYKQLSEKTLSTQFHCDSKDTELMLHATMGIITELEELLEWGEKKDVVGIEEEFADSSWYLAIFGRQHNLGFPKYDFKYSQTNAFLKNYLTPIFMYYSDKIVMDMYKKASVLLDILKKKIFYDKKIDDSKVIGIVNDLMLLSVKFAKYHNINIDRAWDINIAKLKARYGEKFSSDKAINRDLVTERNILEGK